MGIAITIICLLLLLAAVIGLPFYSIWRSKDNAAKKKKAREQMHKDVDALQKKYNPSPVEQKMKKVYYPASPIPNTKNSLVQPGKSVVVSAPQKSTTVSSKEVSRAEEPIYMPIFLPSDFHVENTSSIIPTTEDTFSGFSGGESGGGGASGSWNTDTSDQYPSSRDVPSGGGIDTPSYDPPSYYSSSDSTSWSSSDISSSSYDSGSSYDSSSSDSSSYSSND